MHFLDSLQAATPLQLRPDRPASSHLISYHQLQLEQASQDLLLKKERQQLVQIDKLSELIRQKDRQLAEQETKQLERQLLFEIEIDRLRRILSEWDAERRKYQQDSRAKENIYRSKLEELKTQLSAQLTQKVDQIRAQNKQDLQRIKELYDIRVAKLQEEAMKEEHRLRLAEMEADTQQGRLQLSEADRQKLYAAILLKDDRIALLEEEVSQLQVEKRRLKDDNERVIEDRARQLEYARAQQEGKLSEYQSAKELIGELQLAVQQLRADKQQYNEARRQMGNRVVSLQIRCKELQQEVQQFRSRKTQHNAFVRQASQNTLSHQQSDRQQLSHALIRNKASFEDERERVAELEKKLQELARERERQEWDVKQQFQKKEEQLRQVEKEVDVLKRNLQEKERQLGRVRSSANDLQAKLSLKDNLILKLQADLQRRSDQRPNDGGKNERMWVQRIEKAQQALQTLNQQWVKREKELAGLFKKIDSTYRQQLQKAKEVEQRLRKENEDVHGVLMEKIKQLSEVTRQLNAK